LASVLVIIFSCGAVHNEASESLRGAVELVLLLLATVLHHGLA